MSINTDLASIEIIATVHRAKDLNKAFQFLVDILHRQVPYFDWVGLFLAQGGDLQLAASSNDEDHLTWETNAELRIPIESDQGELLGKIVVRSRQHICFDVTDVSTLKTVAYEVGQRIGLH